MATRPQAHRFPDWFPPDCPSPAAEDARGEVYRFASNDPLTADDFRSHHELGLAPRTQKCRRCSLSVYRTIESARKKLRELRARSPARFGRYLAIGTLSAELGKLMQAGVDPDHLEWWAYEGVERHANFRIAETLEK